MSGYKFQGWSTSSTGSVNYSANSTYTWRNYYTSNIITLYAVWERDGIDETDVEITVNGFTFKNNTLIDYSGSATNVVIPSSYVNTSDNKTYPVLEIDGFSISGSSVRTIEIPSTIENIGTGAFTYVSGQITSISVDSNNKHYVSVDGVLFTYDMKTLVQYPGSKTNTTYTIPNSVVKIDYSAFSLSGNLRSITIPSNISSIGNGAFQGCSNLTSINLPQGVKSLGSGVFWGCSNLTSLTLNSTTMVDIDPDILTGCDNLTYIYVPNNLVQQYKQNTNWSEYANKIVGM